MQGIITKNVLADSGFYSISTLQKCHKREEEFFMPDHSIQIAKRGTHKGYYYKTKFKKTADGLICPAGSPMRLVREKRFATYSKKIYSGVGCVATYIVSAPKPKSDKLK